MVLSIVILFCVFAALGVGVLAAWSDFKGFTIPNTHSIIIIALFFFAYAVSAAAGQGTTLFFPILNHLGAALFIFVVTYALFYFGVIGGGDSKLATAFAFWLGVQGLFPFLFYMSVIGGVMGVFSLILKKYKPFTPKGSDHWVAQSQNGANKIPYGIAISGAAIVSFVILGYIDVTTLM